MPNSEALNSYEEMGGPDDEKVTDEKPTEGGYTTEKILEEANKELGGTLGAVSEGEQPINDVTLEAEATRYEGRGREVAANRVRKIKGWFRKGARLGSEFFRETNKKIPLLAPEVMAANGAEYARDSAVKMGKNLAILGLTPVAAIQERIKKYYAEEEWIETVEKRVAFESGLVRLSERNEKDEKDVDIKSLASVLSRYEKLTKREDKLADMLTKKGTLSRLLSKLKGK